VTRPTKPRKDDADDPEPPPCEHTRLRCWASTMDTSGSFILAPGAPRSTVPGTYEVRMQRRSPRAEWCPKCLTRWAHPRDEAEDAKPVEQAGAWSIFLMPDASLTVTSSGTLSSPEAEFFAVALREATRASAELRDALLDRDRWRIDFAKGCMVLHRHDRGRHVAVNLGPITPRKGCTCDLCEKPIAAGTPAWKGLAGKPPIGHEVQGAGAFRVCAGCVRDLAPPPTPEPLPWPVRGLEC